MTEIQLNIPTASDARKSIENGLYEKAQNQAAKVQSLIVKAISEGRRSVSLDDYLESAVAEKLKSLGYKYESGSHRNETYASVSW
jgi:hypothetical protein